MPKAKTPKAPVETTEAPVASEVNPQETPSTEPTEQPNVPQVQRSYTVGNMKVEIY